LKTDLQYIRGLKNGEYPSFDALFNKYAESLFAFVFSITKDFFIAEEVTQEVFTKVWEKRGRIEEHYSFKAFLFSVTYNETISYLRKQKSEKNKIASYTSMKAFDSNETEYEVEFKNLESIANKVIDELPDKRKQIFKMSREQGLTNKEIADELQISIKTVENQMTSTLKVLREKLGSENNSGLFFYFLFFHQ
jgi:RNA polymerase sigma-70 factor (ECF subfamily)